MRRSVMRVGMRSLAVLAVTVCPLQAQDPDCTAAAGRLDSGLRTGSQFTSDVQLMPRCPNGAATLASVWASAPASTTDLQVLLDGTLRFHDQRLFSALQTAAQSAQGTAVRVAAVGSMLSYVDSALSAYLPTLLATGTSPKLGAITWVSGASILYGESAPPVNARATVLGTLEQMAGSGGVPEMQAAASRLQRGVYNVINLNTADIELAFVSCNRYRVRNPNPVAVALRYEVYGTTDRETFAAPPRAVGTAYGESFIVTRACGTTLLYYFNVLVDAVVPVHGCGC